MSGGAAGERLNRARLGIRVPGCSIAWGLGGLGPAICQGEFLLLERSRSMAAQTVAAGRCFEFLLFPFIERSVTLYSSFVTVSNTSSKNARKSCKQRTETSGICVVILYCYLVHLLCFKISSSANTACLCIYVCRPRSPGIIHEVLKTH